MRLVKRLMQIVALVAIAAGGSAIVEAVQGNWFLALVLGLTVAGVVLAVYGRLVRWAEGRVPAEVAREGAAAATGRGALIGLAMFLAVVLNLAVFGFYHIEGFNSLGGALGLFGIMASAAVVEEVLFRGLLFRIVEQWTGTWIALVLSALLFGLSHLGNPDATLWGATAIAIEAGCMLAAAYAATRTLWLPIGLHFGWNFAVGGIFGSVVSGNGASQGLLQTVTSGPALLTGGAFGPEGSPYAVVFGLVLTIVFMRMARRRGNIVPMRRRDRQAPVSPAQTDTAVALPQ
jgi:membrane protease YdiL (CAAX protease family)